MENDTKPLITIIMSILNVADDLKISLDNFDRQTFRDFELIIADGMSKDNPTAHVVGRSFPIRHFIQPDKGIYDAWNKVLPDARGDWIIFMGAGDEFDGPDVLERCAEYLRKMPEDVPMAYGQVKIIGENDQVVDMAGLPWPEATKRIQAMDMFPHQATFQRRSTLARYGDFAAEFRIAGDLEMILRLAAHHPPVYFPVTIAHFKYGGTSSHFKNRYKMTREAHLVLKRHGIPHRSRFKLLKAWIISFLWRRLPNNAVNRISDVYRSLLGKKVRYGK